MSFRFNNGRGAVVCDECGWIFDTHISPEQYKEAYVDPYINKEEDFCWNCITKKRKKDKYFKLC